jgi:hypothetical protein
MKCRCKSKEEGPAVQRSTNEKGAIGAHFQIMYNPEARFREPSGGRIGRGGDETCFLGVRVRSWRCAPINIAFPPACRLNSSIEATTVFVP